MLSLKQHIYKSDPIDLHSQVFLKSIVVVVAVRGIEKRGWKWKREHTTKEYAYMTKHFTPQFIEIFDSNSSAIPPEIIQKIHSTGSKSV